MPTPVAIFDVIIAEANLLEPIELSVHVRFHIYFR